jgi:dTDP-4-dehydrorhamnose 3,5-epimerase
VAVDLRRGSPTFGRWFGLELSEENFKQLLIPKGFAHGYVSLRPGTEFLYKVDALYEPSLERGLRYDDPTLSIQWPVKDPILSEKDQSLPGFSEFQSPFEFGNDR